MRSKSPELMERICSFVGNYYRDNHASPSLRKIADGVDIARTTAYRYLIEMDERGMLSYDGHSIKTPEIKKYTAGYFSAPIVGSIPCGDPAMEEEQVEEYVRLPQSIFGQGDFYLLRASGDSMVDAGIQDGDLVVIEKRETAEIGDIVVALDGDNENTLKTFAGLDPETKCAVLRFENKRKYRNKEIHVPQLTVQGVARHVIKAL